MVTSMISLGNGSRSAVDWGLVTSNGSIFGKYMLVIEVINPSSIIFDWKGKIFKLLTLAMEFRSFIKVHCTLHIHQGNSSFYCL